MNSDYYKVGEADGGIIHATDLDEAMDEWYCSLLDEDLEDLPETVEVYGFSPSVPKPTSKIFEWGLEGILENLDENYTYEDYIGDYKPSNKVIYAYKVFCETICEDFKPTLLTESGEKIAVNVKGWIKENIDEC